MNTMHLRDHLTNSSRTARTGAVSGDTLPPALNPGSPIQGDQIQANSISGRRISGSLVIDPALGLKACQELAATLTAAIGEQNVAIDELETRIGVPAGWIEWLLRGEFSLAEIELPPLARLANHLGIAYSDLLPANPYRLIERKESCAAPRPVSG